MSDLASAILGLFLGLFIGVWCGAWLSEKAVFRAGVVHGRNLEWCESRGGQWRDAKCWQQEIKR